MAHASIRPSVRLAVLLLAGGLLVGLNPFAAGQTPAKPASTDPPSLNKDNNYKNEAIQLINQKIEETWKANKITPSEVCTDHEFIRRATLDIVGRIPHVAEIQQFLKDPKETRRALLIDRLLKHEDYAINFANLWSNWLLTRSGQFGRGEYHYQTHKWLADQFVKSEKSEDPYRYDDMVRKLLTATGKNTDDTNGGAVNFILAHLGEPVPPNDRRDQGHFDMVPITSRITRLFLGIQTQCAQCHAHPFDNKIKQEHFWSINVFLRQVRREGMQPKGRRDSQFPPLTLSDDPSVNKESYAYFETRGAVPKRATPGFFDATVNLALRKEFNSEGFNRREKLAELILNHENFPKAYVNRLWAHFFGRGFTNPIDDFNEQNQPSHPELLNELAIKFKHYGYNQKDLIRWICNSKPYQLKATANPTNDKSDAEVFFSRMLLKPMSPEQLFESLMVATGQNLNTADKRQQRERWMNRLISNFGDDEGNEVTFNGTVVQALMMMNGQDINNAIADKEGTVAKMLARGGQPVANIQHLYLVALGRPLVQTSTYNELNTVLRAMPFTDPKVRDKDLAAPYQDLLWALLNSNEFLLNH
jgi:hypothetical protein